MVSRGRGQEALVNYRPMLGVKLEVPSLRKRREKAKIDIDLAILQGKAMLIIFKPSTNNPSPKSWYEERAQNEATVDHTSGGFFLLESDIQEEFLRISADKKDEIWYSANKF